jgi:hypothetical protein
MIIFECKNTKKIKRMQILLQKIYVNLIVNEAK